MIFTKTQMNNTHVLKRLREALEADKRRYDDAEKKGNDDMVQYFDGLCRGLEFAITLLTVDDNDKSENENEN